MSNECEDAATAEFEPHESEVQSEAGEGNTLLDIDRVRQLIEMMVANDLVELSLRDGDIEVNLRRPNPKTAEQALVTVPMHPQHPHPHYPSGPPIHDAPVPAAVSDVKFHEIRSPMVGSFYAAPDPDSPPFVQVGGTVGPNTVVCLLEAMKVFSEIKAETSGVIERILATDGQAVEFGQPLFLVRPF